MRLPSLKEIGTLFKPQTRGYRDVAGVGPSNADWNITMLGEDADLYQNAYLLTARMRDLFKTNPVYVKYRELLWANIFGENGIMLRMKIKETEDRVVNTPDEKWALLQYERRINRLREWAEKRTGIPTVQFRAFKMADEMERSSEDAIIRGKAKIQIGDPDVFANLQVERAWAKWQRAEFCDIRGYRNYHTLRQLRLINGVRDGDFFIRRIRDPKANAFGYTQQLISAEWCDRFYNDTLPNGNVVIMGIEYEMSPWGIGKKLAYYFIKRQPTDWQYTFQNSLNFSTGQMHTRIDASEIIHYARPVDSDSTRPAPWAASTIPKARQLDQYELAEVIASREHACSTGYYYSDVLPEGGYSQEDIDPRTGMSTAIMGPGETRALKAGIQYKERQPLHPTMDAPAFRKMMGQSTSAGMPGGDYNILFNDLENINFSAGRLGRLDTNEMSKMLQRFDIDIAERVTFEDFLEMALATGAIKLPLAKFDKFNRPLFQGRRWAQVDEIKAINAAALRIANKLSSRNRECAEEGIDFEENAKELAEEEMILEMLGLDTAMTVEHEPPAVPAQDAADDDAPPAPATGGTTKPAAKKPVAKHNGNGNGQHELAFERAGIMMPITVTTGKVKKTINIRRDLKGNITGADTEESD